MLLKQLFASGSWIFSNYWMRPSTIWRILQIKEGVIHRGRRPRWITPSEISSILHILRKPNSIIALLFIENISSSLIQYGEDFDVIGSIIFGRLYFWRHWFNIAKILSKFGEQQLVMVNYACSLNQSETGKYFEWIINTFSKFSAPTIAFLAFWLAKKLRLWANSRSFTSYGK